MPKIAQEYTILDTESEEKAKKLIGFEVVRLPAFCELNGTRIQIPKESIFRKEGLVHYETLSPEYGLISHVDAFETMLQALKGHPSHLIRITLERSGAEMTAKFRLKESAAIKGKNLTHSEDKSRIHPEFTLVNSYNCATSLSLRLGAHHLPVGVSSLIGTKGRWMHLGNKPDPGKFTKAISEGLEQFEKTLGLYGKMLGRMTINYGQACVICAVKEEIVPKKMGRQVFTRVSNSGFGTTSLWQIYNSLLWPVSHDYEGTPSHGLLIQKNIAEAFSDGGFSLYERSRKIDQRTLQEWIDRSTDAA